MRICKFFSTFAVETQFIKLKMISRTLFRVLAYAKYLLTSWNTGGEGIHSPYLFYIVRMLLCDRNSYYSWGRIEQRRLAMLNAPKPVNTQDFGTGESGRKMVNRIAKVELEKAHNAQIFFRLVSFLGHDRNEPLEIVELGTSLGITTAYLAMADSRNVVYTYEGSLETLAVAKQNWTKLGVENIRAVEGNIDDTLYNYARAKKKVDFAFLDANHQSKATWAYFSELVKWKHDKSIFVIDDIHYSRDMESVWKKIKGCDFVSSTMDCFDFGIVFFDPHYLKRNYILRV